MNSSITDIYRGWSISVTPQKNACANFSFDITDSTGNTQHVTMGGVNEQRALERAKETIDLEIAIAEELS